MLDFYLLADDQSMPSYPKEGEHKLLGSVDDQIIANSHDSGLVAYAD